MISRWATDAEGWGRLRHHEPPGEGGGVPEAMRRQRGVIWWRPSASVTPRRRILSAFAVTRLEYTRFIFRNA